MKKSFSILAVLCILSSCSNIETTSGNYNQIPLFLNNIYFSKKFKVDINGIELVIDDLSYKNINENKTFFKYVFKDGYQVYDNTSITDQIIENNLLDNLYSLINVRYYNATYFDITNEEYTLKKDFFNIFDVSYFGVSLNYMNVYYQNDNVIFNMNIEDNNYKLIFSYSETSILPFNTNDNDYNSFYKINEINYSTFKEKNDANTDFVCVYTSYNCYACKKAEKLFYQFSYEYKFNFVCIDVNDITNEEKNDLLKDIIKQYDEQNNFFKDKNYNTYPEYFLTPTTVRYTNGSPFYVKLGFTETDGNAFIKLCLENIV